MSARFTRASLSGKDMAELDELGDYIELPVRCRPFLVERKLDGPAASFTFFVSDVVRAGGGHGHARAFTVVYLRSVGIVSLLPGSAVPAMHVAKDASRRPAAAPALGARARLSHWP